MTDDDGRDDTSFLSHRAFWVLLAICAVIDGLLIWAAVAAAS
jgi:hypothetical protein